MTSLSYSQPKKKDPGKEVEGHVQRWLEARSSTELGFAWHRMPDAKAARGALAAQPADFLVCRFGVIVNKPTSVGSSFALKLDVGVKFGQLHLVEAKETKQANRLPKDKVSQFGKLYLFHLAGARVAVVVYRSSLNDWVLLTNEHLFASEECPASFPFAGLKSHPTHESLLKELFP